MADRETLFRKFGPLLEEGVVLMMLEGVNELRVKAGLRPYTVDQALTRLENILDSLDPYDWIIEGP